MAAKVKKRDCNFLCMHMHAWYFQISTISFTPAPSNPHAEITRTRLPWKQYPLYSWGPVYLLARSIRGSWSHSSASHWNSCRWSNLVLTICWIQLCMIVVFPFHCQLSIDGVSYPNGLFFKSDLIVEAVPAWNSHILKRQTASNSQGSSSGFGWEDQSICGAAWQSLCQELDANAWDECEKCYLVYSACPCSNFLGLKTIYILEVTSIVPWFFPSCTKSIEQIKSIFCTFWEIAQSLKYLNSVCGLALSSNQ